MASLAGRARPLAFPLGVFALSRVLVLAAAAVGTRIPPGNRLINLLTFWDGGWYVQIADHGYAAELTRSGGEVQESAHAFFPLYPFVIRTVGWLSPLSTRTSAAIIATVFGALVVVLVWQLTAELADRAAANRAVILLAFFPASFVLSWGYAEPMMLAFVAGTLLALVRRQWVVAGVLGALATATRPNAIVVVAACAWAAGEAILRRREWRALAAPLLAPLGAVAFHLFLWHRTGELGVWFRVQREGWDQRVDLGARLADVVGDFFADPVDDLNGVIAVLAIAVMAVGVVLVLRDPMPSALKVYALGIFALAMASNEAMARPRFVLAALPLFVALGRRVRGDALAVVAALSAGALALLVFVYCFPHPIALPP